MFKHNQFQSHEETSSNNFSLAEVLITGGSKIEWQFLKAQEEVGEEKSTPCVQASSDINAPQSGEQFLQSSFKVKTFAN